MCEASEILMAWLDGELEESGAAEMEQHLRECAPCREQAGAYRRAAEAFGAYCDAYCERSLSAKARPQVRPWLPIAKWVAGIAAAVVAFFLLLLGAPMSQSPARTAAAVEVAAPAGTQGLQRGAGTILAGESTTSPSPEEAAVEITIPADAIFPPGAVPPGVAFSADVMIAPDGSAQEIRLRPQLAEFQRRPTQ